MRSAILALCLAGLGSAAAAEWSYDPAPMPAGEARGTGAEGVALAVTCGNGGLPAVEVLDAPLAPGQEPLFVVSVDGGAESLVPGTCAGDRCLMEFDTLPDALGLIRALRFRNRVDLGL